MIGFSKFLSEERVNLGGGAKYGQVILLMGGAGSGKSTATRRFVNTRGYKVINPDDIKGTHRACSRQRCTGVCRDERN